MDLKKCFNCDSKKRGLSSETLNSDNDAKKVCDGILDDSNNPDDVFADDYLLQAVLRFIQLH